MFCTHIARSNFSVSVSTLQCKTHTHAWLTSSGTHYTYAWTLIIWTNALKTVQHRLCLYFISIFHWLINIRKNLQIGNFGSFRTFCSSSQINTTSAAVPDWRRIGSNPMTYISAGSVPDEITQIHLIGPQYLKIESFYSAVLTLILWSILVLSGAFHNLCHRG